MFRNKMAWARAIKKERVPSAWMCEAEKEVEQVTQVVEEVPLTPIFEFDPIFYEGKK